MAHQKTNLALKSLLPKGPIFPLFEKEGNGEIL
jgi:hypothetical protein